MKNTMKVFLVIALFSSMAFADGDMGTGNKTCPQGTTCFVNPNGSTDAPETKVTDDATVSSDSILEDILAYFDAIFK